MQATVPARREAKRIMVAVAADGCRRLQLELDDHRAGAHIVRPIAQGRGKPTYSQLPHPGSIPEKRQTFTFGAADTSICADMCLQSLESRPCDALRARLAVAPCRPDSIFSARNAQQGAAKPTFARAMLVRGAIEILLFYQSVASTTEFTRVLFVQTQWPKTIRARCFAAVLGCLCKCLG